MSIADMVREISPFSFAGRVIRLPLRLVPRSAVVRVLSGVNRGQRWIAGASETNSCWIGTYESNHVSALQKIVRPGMVVYDIGANVGFYTLALSRLVGDSGHVYSFEPEARNAYLLRRHIEMNKLRNITLVQAAVSHAAGMVKFEGTMSTGRITSRSSYWIPSISLDEFIAAGNPLPSFIKMDIEGGECTALDGAGVILSKGEALWMLATHGAQLKARCLEVLAQYGYCFAGFDGSGGWGEAADFLAYPPLPAVPLGSGGNGYQGVPAV